MVVEMDKRNNLVVLGLGGNVGDVKRTLKDAVKRLEGVLGEIVMSSSLYRTQAWGVENQPDFLNQAIVLDTKLPPNIVLKRCLEVEIELGRDRISGEKWQQRVVDIDVLFYNQEIIKTDDLTIPHPYIQERNFVLFPLVEIIPNFEHPILKKTVLELKKTSNDRLQINKVLT